MSEKEVSEKEIDKVLENIMEEPENPNSPHDILFAKLIFNLRYDLRYQKQLTELRAEITELREYIKNHSEQINELKEVLRGLIEACRHWDNDKIMDRLLAKLDSGGEKDLVERMIKRGVRSDRADFIAYDDEKPPEPIVYKGHYFDDKQERILVKREDLQFIFDTYELIEKTSPYIYLERMKRIKEEYNL